MNPDNKNVELSSHHQKRSNTADEIDLLEVITQLWNGKKTIIIGVIVAMLFAGVYLFFAKEKWTSTAIVATPTSGMIANYNASLSVLYKQTPADKPPLPDLQNQFFGRFAASMTALSSALRNLAEPQMLKVDQVVKGSNDQLSVAYTANTSKDAQAQLTKYIEHINDKIVDGYTADLRRTLGVKTNELSSALDTQKQVAIDKKQQRIDAIKQALTIAEASGVKTSQLNQAEYLSDDTLFLLGTSALQSMIQNEATKPLLYDQSYYDTQSALLAVTHMKIDLSHLQSYRYISTADLPIRRDSPKKMLVMLLAIILGGVVGSGIVIGRNVSASYRLRKNS
ncbi:LPS O-antigen chain length determinant protein WzzB [Erwinia persicina]|uniref:LPS O-antigen chain length determinant protein WzzB n=1 Tax=Erwinia persicina TaxID=55211 RepID=UPI0007868F7B|nr:LPS O-antigen chain length determinant protein WzzB [Erwinia persicina]